MEIHIQAMGGGHGSKLLSITTCLLLVIMLNTQVVRSQNGQPMTFIPSAVAKGAVCLDGTPPAYSFAPGYGSGANSWMLYMEGGAWCNSTADCKERSSGWLGNSTTRLDRKIYFNGMFTGNQTFNPDFYNWNKVNLVYCDGASFSGDVEEVDPQSNLTYRGARVFNAIMEDLLAKGMNVADNVILSGGSAGGLATLLHCDNFRQQIVPNAKRVKCISDGGFFLHAKNLPGAKEREDYFTSVVEHHQMAKNIPSSCTSRMNPGLCLFPENLIDDIQTPLFMVETSFDSHQLKEMLTPFVGGGKPEWHDCLFVNIALCSPTQIQVMQEFQKTFLNTLQSLKSSPSRGMFVDTCYDHTQIHVKALSVCASVTNNLLENKSMVQAIGDWYFDRTNFQQIDTNNLPRNCSSNLSEYSYEFNRQCMEFIRDHKG